MMYSCPGYGRHGGCCVRVCVNCHEHSIMVLYRSANYQSRRERRKEGRFPEDGNRSFYGRTGGITGLILAPIVCFSASVHALLSSCLMGRLHQLVCQSFPGF